MNQNFQNRNTFRCPNCGAPVNGPFCTNCGQHFAYSPYKKNKTATNYIISFVGLILFILIINSVIKGYRYLRNNTETLTQSSTVETREEYISSSNVFDYYDIYTNPSSHKGERISICGKVVQVISSSSPYYLRVATEHRYWMSDVVYLKYSGEIANSIQEDTYIIAYGQLLGNHTYKNILFTDVTIPYIDVKYVYKVSEDEAKEYYLKFSIANDCALTYPELPFDIISSYWLSNEIDTTLTITEISYSFTENFEGTKVNAKLLISGTKTYDRLGDGNSGRFFLEYKVFDDENFVVDSGSSITNSLVLNESFRNHEINIYGLEPGNYRIEFTKSN